MQLLIAFLVAMTIIGASPRASWVRDRPAVLAAICAIVALGFYSYRVVL